jgi:hypothetical protein
MKYRKLFNLENLKKLFNNEVFVWILFFCVTMSWLFLKSNMYFKEKFIKHNKYMGKKDVYSRPIE